MNIKCTDFFGNDYVDQASYDNLRKIASAVDGLKNSNRKVIHTVLDKNINQLLKVQQLSAKASEYTDYLHGSLDSVIVTLGQNYTGSNQIPLLTKKGNFGTRAIPEASAPRYIYAKGAPYLDNIFLKEDRDILIHQNFEGQNIEPRYFVPTIPLILINGNRGVSSGFSQYIAPRDAKEIINVLTQRLKGKITDFNSVDELSVSFGPEFKGSIERDETGDSYRWFVEGSFEVKRGKTTEIIINELPIDCKVRDYVEYLEKLKENKTIKDFDDCCDGDLFKFKITMPRGTNDTSHNATVKLFKLQSSFTENFTCIGPDNRIHEFSKPSQIMECFYNTKLASLIDRKKLLIKNLNHDLKIKQNQMRFINSVLFNEIDLRKLNTQQLLEYFSTHEFYQFENFKYLLNIPAGRLTRDKVESLQKEINDLNESISSLNEKTPEKLWLEDIQKLKF